MPTIKIQATGLIDRNDSALTTPVRLDNGDSVLTVHWCAEDGVCGIRWTRLPIDW